MENIAKGLGASGANGRRAASPRGLNFFERSRLARREASAQSSREASLGAIDEGDGSSTEQTSVKVQVSEVSVPDSVQKLGSALDRLRQRAGEMAATVDFPVEDFGDDAGGDAADDLESDGAREAKPSGAVSFEGVVISLRVFNDWGVGSVRGHDGTMHKIIGESVASLEEGLSYAFEGSERVHPVHGRGIEVRSAQPTLDVDENAIIKYLAKTFDGVGLRRATAYVSAINADDPSGASLKRLRDVLLNEPWNLDVSAVVSGLPRIRAPLSESAAA